MGIIPRCNRPKILEDLFIYLVLKIILKFIYFWLRWVFIAARGLFLVAASGGLLFVLLCRLLIAVAFLIAEHGL